MFCLLIKCTWQRMRDFQPRAVGFPLQRSLGESPGLFPSPDHSKINPNVREVGGIFILFYFILLCLFGRIPDDRLGTDGVRVQAQPYSFEHPLALGCAVRSHMQQPPPLQHELIWL